jgi:lipid-binding SYLF domain-containing protein
VEVHKKKRRGPMSKRNWIIVALWIGTTLPAFTQNKIEDRTGESAEVLTQILSRPNAVPQALLDKSVCVLVFPAVKKVGIGVGVTYGRGVIACRTGVDMTGVWSAPAMYKLDVGSLGVQLGRSTTDYVLLIENKATAMKVLSGKLKLGADATAVAGPTGAKAVAANDVTSDILTYSRAKSGLFAGAALGSASMDTDDDANKVIYGKSITATEIVRGGGVEATPAGKTFVNVLDRASPSHV